MLDRKFAPQPGKLDVFELPKVISLKAENGLQISSVVKSKLPIVQFDFVVFFNNAFQQKAKAGLPNLTLMVIDEGAGKYSALELAEEFEKLGSFFSIETHLEYANFSVFTLKENVERTFELFSMILQEPHFYEEDFTREKNKALTNLIRLSDEPQYLSNVAFKKILFDGTQLEFPRLGLIKTLNEITLDDCRNFYNDNFKIENMYLISTGDIAPDELQRLINKYLNNLKVGISNSFNKNSAINKKKNFYLINKENSVQSEIKIGRISSPRHEGNFFARTIMNIILGGDFVSRINLNLREDKGYTYGANSFFSYYKKIGNFEISTAVETKNTVDTIKEIFKELDNIRISITDDEIEFAKSYLIKKFPSAFESYGQITRNIFNLIYFSLPSDYYENYIKSIQSVPKSEVIKSALQEIISDEMQIVIVGDAKKLNDELRNTFLININLIDKNELITGN